MLSWFYTYRRRAIKKSVPYPEGFRREYTGLGALCAQINEKQLKKISFFQILGDKIFIAIVSKHSKIFNFTIFNFI